MNRAIKDKRGRIKIRKIALNLIIPVIIVIGWAVIAISINNQFIIPRLGSVLSVLLTPFVDILGSGPLLYNAFLSLKRVTLGFMLAAVIAIPLGIGMGRSELVYDLFDKVITVLRPIPPIAWIPIALAWFKIGLGSMIFIIGIGAFFPILLNTIDGVRGVKRTWIESITMLGAKEHDLLARVILPGAAPMIWTGLRIAFGIAWMCVVAAEMLPGTNSGLGYLIINSYNWGQTQIIIAGMVIIGLIGLCVDRIFVEVGKRKFSWRELEK